MQKDEERIWNTDKVAFLAAYDPAHEDWDIMSGSPPPGQELEEQGVHSDRSERYLKRVLTHLGWSGLVA